VGPAILSTTLVNIEASAGAILSMVDLMVIENLTINRSRGQQ
jgi:hypothetical protein